MSDALAPAADLAARRQPVFSGESADYAAARRDLLAAEIEARRVLTRLADQRRALPPGPAIDKDYRFRDDEGRERSLLDLFGERDTLIAYFWMYGPDRAAPCPMCTNTLAGLDPVVPDIEQRAAFVVMAAARSIGSRRSPSSVAGVT